MKKVVNADRFDDVWENVKEINQEFSSADTSINSGRLPAIFKLISLPSGTVNLDYGGGRYDNVADYYTQYDVINMVFDPFNRSSEHNQEVIKKLREIGGADSATISNVLNVIKEKNNRIQVLQNVKNLIKPGAPVYITVYEGKANGAEGKTKSGYQLNRKTADYLEEIQEVFPDATRHGKLITAATKLDSKKHINASYHWPNGDDISGTELNEVLDTMYGKDRDKNNSHYTNIDIKNAIKYYDNLHSTNITASNTSKFDHRRNITINEHKYSVYWTYKEKSDTAFPIERFIMYEVHTHDNSEYAWINYFGGRYAQLIEHNKVFEEIEFPIFDFSKYKDDIESGIDSYLETTISELADIVEEENSQIGDEMIYSSKYIGNKKSIKASDISYDNSEIFELENQKYSLKWSYSANTSTSYPIKTLYLSELHPYDDASYAWIKYSGGSNAHLIKDGKTIDTIKLFTFDPDDYEVYDDNTSELEQYFDDIVDELVKVLRDENSDVAPRIIHNSTHISNNKQSVQASAIMAADFNEDDFGDIDDSTSSDNSTDLDDQESTDDTQDSPEVDVTTIDTDNNITDHYIAECDQCHGIFISSVKESVSPIRSIQGICPLCNKTTTQYLKWIIRGNDAPDDSEDENFGIDTY